MSRWGAALALLASLSVWFGARAFLIDPPFPMWDEGTHLGDAITAYETLSSGGLKEVLLYLDSPLYYPFVHPLLVALTWLLTGISLAAARLISMAAALLLIPGFALIAREALAPGDRAPATLVASSLLLGSPAVRELQGLVMLDLVGTALTLFAIVAHVRWMKEPRPARAAALAALVLACFFTKYNYGIVLGAALVVHVLLVPGSRLRRIAQQAVLLGGAALLWLYQEPEKKMTILLEYLTNRLFAVSPWEQAAYPVVSIVRDHAAFVPVGLVVLAAFAAAFRRFPLRSPAGVLLLLPLVQAAAQAVSSNQQPRHVLPAVPALALAAAAALVAWAGRSRPRRAAVAALAAASALPLLLPAAFSLRTPSYRERADLRALDAFARGHFAGRPLLLVGAFFEYPPSLGRFAGLEVAAAARTGRIDLAAPPLLEQAPPALHRELLRFVADPPLEVAAALARGLASYRARYGDPVPVLVLRLGPDSPFRYHDYEAWNAWQEPLAAAVERAPGATLVESRSFERSQLEARVYEVRR